MLHRCPIPGLFITGTDTGIGKTVITAAIASHLRMIGKRVAVCKPIATGCVHRREGLVSEDAEFLAHHADAEFPLDLICPQRYAEPLAPAVAAEREKRPVDWEAINRSIRIMAAASNVMLCEGVGGVLVPLDEQHTVIDMAKWLGLPVIVVARAALGTINHTLLTLQALRLAGINVAGVIINRFATDSIDVAEQTNPAAIEKWGKTRILALVPPSNQSLIPNLPPDLTFP
ncbi:MAG TPA: dethiobiotin synthase, partial [Tepidisphaeraceae bacterium]